MLLLPGWQRLCSTNHTSWEAWSPFMTVPQEQIDAAEAQIVGCFRHQLLLPRPYLVLTKPLRLDIQCQRGASVKIGWKYLEVSG